MEVGPEWFAEGSCVEYVVVFLLALFGGGVGGGRGRWWDRVCVCVGE